MHLRSVSLEALNAERSGDRLDPFTRQVNFWAISDTSATRLVHVIGREYQYVSYAAPVIHALYTSLPVNVKSGGAVLVGGSRSQTIS